MGSTDVVEALGLAPWEGAGPMRLYLQKTDPDAVDDTTTPDMDWGHVMEPVLLDWYMRDHGGAPAVPGYRWQHPEESWLFATLDGMRADRNVECKLVGPAHARDWDESLDDGIPHYVRAQVQIGMSCRRVDRCDVVATICGRPPHVWVVPYDAGLTMLVIEGGRRFWHDHVLARKPPPFDATPATKEYLRRRYPKADPVILDARGTVLDSQGMTRATLAANVKQLQAQIATLDAEILSAIGEHTGAEGTGWKMTWKPRADGKRVQRFTARGEE